MQATTATELTADETALLNQLSSMPQVPGMLRATDGYPTPDVVFANGVIGKSALVYGQPLGFRALMLDLYLPAPTAAKPAKGYPLVVYIHGGAWMLGDRRNEESFANFPDILAALAARGYVVAAVDYRFSSEAKFPVPVQDVKQALNWLRWKGAMYDINPDLAIVWGISAGGHLAALTAVSQHAPALEPDSRAYVKVVPGSPPPTSLPVSANGVQACVSWFGCYDFAALLDESHASDGKPVNPIIKSAVRALLGGDDTTNRESGVTERASPQVYVNEQTPPMLLIVGANDKVVPPSQTLEMAKKLKAAGVPHELLVLPEVDHMLMGSAVEQSRDANLKALAATFRFFDQVTQAAT